MAEFLDVYCFDEHAGRLYDERPMRFVYSAEWLDRGRPALSQSLPLHAESAYADTFFEGLLPEGEPRRTIARSIGVSESNSFALLRELGWDCAGAVSIFPATDRPPANARGEDVKWLDDEALGALIDELPNRPLMFDESNELRLSLAGVQDKVPVVLDEGRIGLSGSIVNGAGRRRTPSTAIIKSPISRFEGTVVNEAFCLELLRKLGVGAVSATPHRAIGREFLLVERYDRDQQGGRTIRLHQEDFCQALGVSSDRKYESEGGPSLADAFTLVREVSTAPAVDVLTLLDATAFNFIVGNHDAHGKNFSLLMTPSGVRLAPIYDVLSTFVYCGVNRSMSSKLAMKIGGEYRWDYVERRHFDRFFADAGVSAPGARRRIRALADASVETGSKLRDEYARRGWDDPVLDALLSLISNRVERLHELFASE